jgi:hypothetical protein
LGGFSVLGEFNTKREFASGSKEAREAFSYYINSMQRTDLARFTDAVLCWTNTTDDVVAHCMSSDDEE